MKASASPKMGAVLCSQKCKQADHTHQTPVTFMGLCLTYALFHDIEEDRAAHAHDPSSNKIGQDSRSPAVIGQA